MFIMGISIHFPEEIQLRVQPRRRHEDTETHHRHFPYRHGYRLVLAFLLLLGLAPDDLSFGENYGLPSGHSTVSVFWVSCNGWPLLLEQPPSLH